MYSIIDEGMEIPISVPANAGEITEIGDDSVVVFEVGGQLIARAIPNPNPTKRGKKVILIILTQNRSIEMPNMLETIKFMRSQPIENAEINYYVEPIDLEESYA